MNIKQAIEHVKKQLEIKVVIRQNNKLYTYRIEFDVKERCYIIYTTNKLTGISSEYAILHELVHAYFMEKVNLLMGIPLYERSQQSFFIKYDEIFNIARDWYVDNYCLELIGREEFNNALSGLRNIVESNQSLLNTKGQNMIVGLGHMYAVFEKSNNKEMISPIKEVNSVKEVLLKASTNPTLSNFLSLSNYLLSIFTHEKVVIRRVYASNYCAFQDILFVNS